MIGCRQCFVIFDNVAVKQGEDPFAGIRRSFIKVYDGGPSFWQIDYRIDADECVDLRVDGGY